MLITVILEIRWLFPIDLIFSGLALFMYWQIVPQHIRKEINDELDNLYSNRRIAGILISWVLIVAAFNWALYYKVHNFVSMSMLIFILGHIGLLIFIQPIKLLLYLLEVSIRDENGDFPDWYEKFRHRDWAWDLLFKRSRDLDWGKQNTVSVAGQNGDFVYVYDKNGDMLFSRLGKLHSYTDSSIAIQLSNLVTIYDAKGNAMEDEHGNKPLWEDLGSERQNAIFMARRKGSFVEVYDESGCLLFSKAGILRACTSSSITIQRANTTTVYDARGNAITSSDSKSFLYSTRIHKEIS
jgi:hypothetical protein